MSEKKQINDVLQLIFEAASRQHQYTLLYTNLCKKLKDHFVAIVPLCDFDSVLWHKCQEVFFAKVISSPNIPPDLPEDEEMDLVVKNKGIMVGTVKFGGDLVLLQKQKGYPWSCCGGGSSGTVPLRISPTH